MDDTQARVARVRRAAECCLRARETRLRPDSDLCAAAPARRLPKALKQDEVEENQP